MIQDIVDREIHVWLASLQLPAAHLKRLGGLLSPAEQQRAECFYFDEDRDRFIASRGILRCILGRYLELQPEQVKFQCGPHGKPALAEDGNPRNLHFNLSHSHELALYAVVLHQEIGVDLEHIRPVQDVARIARHFFSVQEYEALGSLPEDQKQAAFFNCWTRKEAYLKACGDGIAQSLDRFEVSLNPNEPVQLLCLDGSTDKAARWYLHAFTPAPGYLAALAIEGRLWHLAHLAWIADDQHSECDTIKPGEPVPEKRRRSSAALHSARGLRRWPSQPIGRRGDLDHLHRQQHS